MLEKELISDFRRKGTSKLTILAFSLIVFTCFSILLFLLTLSIGKSKNNNINSFADDEWEWAPKGDKIKTKWAEKIDPKNVWPEYPRPQLERKDWLNLNGPWSYSIREPDFLKPEKHDGQILVPFSLESSLSGVMKGINDKQVIWYEKEFEIPKDWKGKTILLHFGAVDWKCTLYINEAKIGEHSGGYSPFYFDITKRIKEGNNIIVLQVFDPTNKGYQPVGKQTLSPGSIWYTPISGIWQTVWLEPVNEYYIKKLEVNNDFDKKQIKITFKLNSDEKLPLNVKLEFDEEEIMTVKGKSNEEVVFEIKDDDFHPWSPSEPNLYNLKVKLFSEDEEVLDSFTSYTNIRKVEQKKDSNGFFRIFLNNEPLFNMGTLDQGY